MKESKISKVLMLVCFVMFIFVTPSSAADYIKVGAPVPLTGYFAGDGVNYLNGIQMAVDEINEKGGLLGKKIKLVKFDTQDFAPERVMLAADQLVGKEKVVAIHAGWGGWGQDVKSYGKYDVPTFLLDASLAAVQVFKEDPKRYHNVFQLVDVEKPAAESQFDLMTESLPFKYAKKTIAMITSDDSWGIENGNAVRARAKEKGWKLVMDETVPYGTTSWAPLLTKIRKQDPGWVYMEVISIPDTATFVREFLKNPPNSLLHVGYVISLVDFAPNIGKDGDGLLGIMPPPPGPEYPSSEVANWVKRYSEKFKLQPAGSSFSTYDGVMIWANAVEKVGDERNYKAINDYIAQKSHKMLTAETGMGRFDLDQKIPFDVTAHNLSQIWEGQVHALYLRGGAKYKYDFKMPPWIKR